MSLDLVFEALQQSVEDALGDGMLLIREKNKNKSIVAARTKAGETA